MTLRTGSHAQYNIYRVMGNFVRTYWYLKKIHLAVLFGNYTDCFYDIHYQFSLYTMSHLCKVKIEEDQISEMISDTYYWKSTIVYHLAGNNIILTVSTSDLQLQVMSMNSLPIIPTILCMLLYYIHLLRLTQIT